MQAIFCFVVPLILAFSDCGFALSWSQKWPTVGQRPSDVLEPKDLIWLQYKSLFVTLGPFTDYIYQQQGNVSDHFLPDIGNGYIATQVGSPSLYMNGVYSGKSTLSHRASLPSPLDWNIGLNNTGRIDWTHSLNAAAGVFISRAELYNFTIEVYTYASRIYPNLIVGEVHSVFNSNVDNVTLHLQQFNNYSSRDVNLSLTNKTDKIILQGKTNDPEFNESDRSNIYAIYDKLPSTFVINKTHPSRIFLFAIGEDKNSVETAYKTGSQNRKQLLSEQVHSWMSMWNTAKVSIRSNSTFLDSIVHACQYYLLSSLPYDSENASQTNGLLYGISPSGLAHGSVDMDYDGHVFWDMETWMYPPILLLYPNLARKMLDYRFEKLSAAKQNSLNYGFQGAKYPWESAKSGFETSPSDTCGRQEIHINGDISLGVQQYLWTLSPQSQQAKWYFLKGREILEEIAKFWVSRAKYNSTSRLYEIWGVMPPDEYVHDVNNSVYTNVVAALALRAPLDMAVYFNTSVPTRYSEWTDMSRQIKIPFNESNNIFLEYDTYTAGQKVKQADVILLAYPLEYPMSVDVLKANLDHYAEVTVSDGPAMTWAMFSLLYSQIKDYKNAWHYFQRSFQYVVEPYLIWSEEPQSKGAVNFLTGMGGFMQSVINGFAGIRLKKGLLSLDPYLPVSSKELLIRGIHFQGSVLTVTITSSCSSYLRKSKNIGCVRLSLISGSSLRVSYSQKIFILSKSHTTLEISWQKINVTLA